MAVTRSQRRLVALAGIFGLSLLSCGREVTGPGDGIQFGRARFASLALDPRFPNIPGTANAASDVAPFTTVRVVLRHPDGSIAKDTVVAFPSTADSVALTLTIPFPLTAPDSGLALSLSMAYVNSAGDTVFRGGPLNVNAQLAGSSGASQPITVPIVYTGTGATASSVTLTPDTGTVVSGTTTQFSAAARDAQSNVIPNTPVLFLSEDTTRATVSSPGSGLVTWKAKRGAGTVIALLLNGKADTSVFQVKLPASQILSISGATQSAIIGTALAAPLVFRVAASDSVGVAGLPVTFVVTTGGGTLAASADTSDALGVVSTSWTLGSLLGVQSITATVTGIAGATRVVTATGTAPIPTQVVITSAPTTAIAGATFTPVTVEVRDAGNALTPLFTGPVTIALDAGATGATLAGATTVNAVAGVATFSALSIQRTATGLTLIATSGALTADTSATITITPAAPAVLAIVGGDAQSGTLGQPLTDSLAVQLRDAFANPIGGATIDFTVTLGGGSVGPTARVSGADGTARTAWTLGATPGTQTARAQLNGTPAIFAAFGAIGSPGVAVRLEVTTEPSAGQVAGVALTPAIVVRAIDAVGATATAFTGTVALGLAANPSATTPAGTLSVAAVAGVATFSDVRVNVVGAGYTLAATSAALAPDTTVAFTVAAGPAGSLATLSGDVQSGAVTTALAAPFVVRVTDAFANPVAGTTVNWAITSGGGALSLTSGVTDAAGQASSSLTLPGVAGSVTVTATALGLSGSPRTFTATATAGAASQLVFTLNTGAGTAGQPITPGWVVQARDGLGNLAGGFAGPVTIVLSNGPPAAVLGGTTTVNAVAGVASFGDLTVDLSASSWVLNASSPGLSGAASATFSIGSGSPAAVLLLAGNAQTGIVGTALTDSIAFAVADLFGNRVIGTPISIGITTGGGIASPSTGNTNSAGEFRTAWTLGAPLGVQSITASLLGLFPVVATATAVPGPAVSLVLATPFGTQIAGDSLFGVRVEARDAAGNVATSFNGVVSGRAVSGPNGPDPDSLPVTAVAGVANFPGVTFDRAGAYVIRFNAVGLPDIFSASFNVVAGPATIIGFASGGGQNGTAGQLLPAPVLVRIEDAFVNPIAGVSVGWVMVRGGVDTLGTATVPTDSLGLSSYQPTLPTTTGTVQFTARVAGLINSPTVFAANVFGDITTQLTMFTQPAAAIAGALLPASAVRARDQYGNLQTVFTGSVTVAIDSGPAGALLTGGTIVAGVAGTATFGGLSLDLAGTYRLRYTAAGLTDAVSSTFVVSAGTATQLSFAQQSAGGVAGALIVPGWVVTARDGAGNVATGFTGAVIVTLGGGNVLAVLGGTTTVNAVSGNATFGDLTVDLVGSSYSLTASASGLTSVTSTALGISAAAPTVISVVAGAAQTGAVSATLTDSVAFRVTDAFGNPVSATQVSIAVTSGGGSLTPVIGNTSVAGEFRTAWTLGAPLGVQSITATVTSVPTAQATATATATAGAAVSLVIASGAVGPQVAGVSLPDVVIQARDVAGNVATSFTGQVLARVDSGPVSDSSIVSAVAGVATFSGNFFETAGDYRLRAVVAGLTDAVSNTFTVSPAPAALIAAQSATTLSGFAGLPIPVPVQVRIEDPFLNRVAGTSVNFVLVRGVDTLSTATVPSDANGLASWQPTLPTTPGAAQVSASSTGLINSPVAFTINVFVGPAVDLRMVVQPVATAAGATLGAISVEATDQFGNRRGSFTGNVTVAVDSGPTGAALGGTTTVAAVSGLADFTTLSVDLVGAYRFRFTTAGLTDAVSSTFAVSPAAPATITAFLGDGQTAPASQVLADSLGARIVDVLGNPIAGATVTWTVLSGAGLISPATSLTDANGVARARWILGATTGPQTVNAGALSLTPATFTANGTPSVANSVWTGSVSSSILNTANWMSGTVPLATDSVLVPSGLPNYPVLPSNIQTGRLTIDSGATVTVGNFFLFAARGIDAPIVPSIVADTGGIALNGTSGAVRGHLPKLYLLSGAYVVGGALVVDSTIIVSGGADLSLSTAPASTGLDFITTSGGTLTMSSGSLLTVQRNALFVGGNTAGRLTGGTLRVGGIFSAGSTGDPAAFAAGPGHVVELNGAATQIVQLFYADSTPVATCSASCFGTLRSLRAAGAGPVSFASNAKALTLMEITGDGVNAPGRTLLSGGTPVLTATAVLASKVGWRTGLLRSGTFIVDTLIAWGADTALIVGETIPTIVVGQSRVRGAHPAPVIVDGNFGVLDVDGTTSIGSGIGIALTTRGNGHVVMQQATDTLVVDGDAEFGGQTSSGLMTAGLMQVSGDLTQLGTGGLTLYANATHRTRLTGTAPTISFAQFGNQLANLDLDATGSVTFSNGAILEGTVKLAPSVSAVGGAAVPVLIYGGLIDSVGGRWQMPTTEFRVSDPQLPTSINGDVVLTLGVVLDTAFAVSGALTVNNGTLDVNGHTLLVGGDFSAIGTGLLRMANVVDTVRVAGTTTFTGASSAGQLTAGRLEVSGTFQQGGSVDAFAASATHQTWFLGGAQQIVAFGSPGTGAGTSHFAALGVAQTVGGTSLNLLTDVWVDGMLLTAPGLSRQLFSATPKVLTSRGADVNGLTFTSVTWSLLDGGPVNAIDSVTFGTAYPTVDQFSILRSSGTIALSNLSFLNAPTTGSYLRVEDPDGATSGSLVVNVTNPTPANNGGFLQVVAPATVNGWPNVVSVAFNWTGGATSGVWTNPANWLGGAVPTASDSVFIPGALLYNPVIPGGTTLRALVSARTESPITVSGPLTITERLVVPTSAGLVCGPGGILLSNATTPMAVSGSLDCFVRVLAGTATATDTLIVANNDLQIEGTAIFDAGADRVTIGQNLSTLAGGRLRMQLDSADVVIINGATFAGGASAGLLTAGELSVSGNFTQQGVGTFAASGTHRTTLVGGLTQMAFDDSLTSAFRRLVFTGADRTLNSRVAVTDSVTVNAGATVRGTGRLLIGGSLAGAATAAITLPALELAGDNSFAGTFTVDTIVLTGTNQILPALNVLSAPLSYANVRVTGSVTATAAPTDLVQILNLLIIDGGTFRIGNAGAGDSVRVEVNGSLRTQNGGVLVMQRDSSRVSVGGNADFAGGSTAGGLLSRGVLLLRNNFTQSGDPESFSANGSHLTQFSTEGFQQITFANPGAGVGSSHFYDLRIQQPGSSGLNLLSDVVALGQLRETMTAIAAVLAPVANPRTLTTGGASVAGITFDNVRWVLGDGAAVDSTAGIAFGNMLDSDTQFEIVRTGGTVTLDGISFATTPATGVYLRVEDSNPGNGNDLTVAVVNPSPVSHSGFVNIVAPALLTGWGINPQAPVIEWIGPVGNNNWSNVANWSLGRLPLPTDSVSINRAASYTVRLDQNAQVGWLVVGGSGVATINHTVGTTLQIDSLAVFSSQSTLNLDGGSSITGVGQVVVGGTFNWNGGSMVGAATTTLLPGAVATIGAPTGTGTPTLSALRIFSIAGDATVRNFGLAATGASPQVVVQATGSLRFQNPTNLFTSANTPTISNFGTLVTDAPGLVRIDWAINNSGTLRVEGGATLDLRNRLTHAAGSIAVLGGSTLVTGGETVAIAPVTIAAGGLLQLQSGGIGTTPGRHVFAPGSSVTGLGTVSFNSADTVRLQGAFDIDSLTILNGRTFFESATDTMFVKNGAYISGGFVFGTGVIGIRGNFRTLSGNLVGSGTIAVLPGATYTPQADVLGWRIDVRGTMTWGDYFFSLGQDPSTLQFASINVLNGGLVDIQHGAIDRDIFGGSATVTTAAGGTIRKSSGTGISTFRQSVIHSGVFDVLTGTLNMQTLSCTVTGGTKTGPGLLVGGCTVP